jgi:hypothetical protein
MIGVGRVMTAPVEDQPISIDLDRLRMMRRMSVHEVDPGLVDESVGESPVGWRNGIAPVAAPMN